MLNVDALLLSKCLHSFLAPLCKSCGSAQNAKGPSLAVNINRRRLFLCLLTVLEASEDFILRAAGQGQPLPCARVERRKAHGGLGKGRSLAPQKGSELMALPHKGFQQRPIAGPICANVPLQVLCHRLNGIRECAAPNPCTVLWERHSIRKRCDPGGCV